MSDTRDIEIEGGERYRIDWDDEEECDHVLYWMADADGDGIWERIGGADRDGICWDAEYVPWQVAYSLCARRATRDWGPP